jgi:hypothetical protein
MKFPRNDDEWRHLKPSRTDTLNDRHPFTITRLLYLNMGTSFGRSHDHRGGDNAHYKPGLVKVIYILV